MVLVLHFQKEIYSLKYNFNKALFICNHYQNNNINHTPNYLMRQINLINFLPNIV